MKREKVSDRYFRHGYGRTRPRKANVYLIEGFAYAKDSNTAKSAFDKLDGELSGYVRVNFYHLNEGNSFYAQVHASDHRPQPI